MNKEKAANEYANSKTTGHLDSDQAYWARIKAYEKGYEKGQENNKDRQRLRAILEGLEVEAIDKLMDEKPSVFKAIGISIKVKCKKAIRALQKL